MPCRAGTSPLEPGRCAPPDQHHKGLRHGRPPNQGTPLRSVSLRDGLRPPWHDDRPHRDGYACRSDGTQLLDTRANGTPRRADGQAVQTISWWDAWALWFSGREVPGETYMGSFTILAWGRLGKLLSFAGGMTIVLDLIGDARTRKIGKKIEPISKRLMLATSKLSDPTSIQTKSLRVLVYSLALLSILLFYVSRSTNSALSAQLGWLILSLVSLIVLARLLLSTANYFALLTQLDFLAARPAVFTRSLAGLLLLIGFHLDLLAS